MSEKKYTNSPITEVVCEFRFDLLEEFSDNLEEKIFEDVKDFFSDTKKAKTLDIEVDVKMESGEPKEEFKKKYKEFEQFISTDKKNRVQLEGGRLSIHRLNPYTGWENFSPIVKKVYDSYIKHVKIKSIKRVGLRYINNFDIPSDSIDTEEYFNLRPVLNNSDLKMSSFFIGTIFSFDSGLNNAKTQLMNKGVSNGVSSFLLDIDYSMSKPDTLLTEHIDSWLESAHNNILNIFESSLTDKTKKLFD